MVSALSHTLFRYTLSPLLLSYMYTHPHTHTRVPSCIHTQHVLTKETEVETPGVCCCELIWDEGTERESAQYENIAIPQHS